VKNADILKHNNFLLHKLIVISKRPAQQTFFKVNI